MALARGRGALAGRRVVDGGLAVGGQGGLHLGCQLADEIEGIDQAGSAELPGVDAALERLDGGGRQRAASSARSAPADGDAGFGFALGGSGLVISVVPSAPGEIVTIDSEIETQKE